MRSWLACMPGLMGNGSSYLSKIKQTLFFKTFRLLSFPWLQFCNRVNKSDLPLLILIYLVIYAIVGSLRFVPCCHSQLSVSRRLIYELFTACETMKHCAVGRKHLGLRKLILHFSYCLVPPLTKGFSSLQCHITLIQSSRNYLHFPGIWFSKVPCFQTFQLQHEGEAGTLVRTFLLESL